MSKWIGHRNVSTTFINYYRPDVSQLTVETEGAADCNDDTHRKACAYDEVRRALRAGASVDHVLRLLRGTDGEEPTQRAPERHIGQLDEDDLFFR